MKIRLLHLLFLALALASCSDQEAEETRALVSGSPGEPIPGLSQEELARFRQGEALFNKVFTPDEGLGPLFNENQCSACHTDPAPGGTGDQFVTQATRYSATEGCDLLAGSGGENVRTRATGLLQALGVLEEEVPENATEVDRFVVPFLFGLGLAEAIPPETLEALADPEDQDGDGVSGRVARTADGRIGLFGRNGAFASIADFNAGAFFLEMGLTNSIHPGPELLNGGPLPEGADPVSDPEVNAQDLGLVADFVRFLAPLAPRRPSDPRALEQVNRGEVLFGEIGCTSCHIPVLETGNHEVGALSEQRVAFYSDFLIHDLGPQASGVCGPDASPMEHRTGILMGVGLRDIFLHNGEALSMEEAILRHGGEAQRAQAAFQALSEVNRHYLIRFLETL